MAYSLTYDEVLERLRNGGIVITVDAKRGKGSHRLLIMEKDGKKISAPVPCHGKRGISIGVLKSLERAFGLPSGFFR